MSLLQPVLADLESTGSRYTITIAYVVCPICGTNVPEDMRDDAYKKRWLQAMKVHLRRPELRVLIALSLLTRVKSTSVTDKVFDPVLRRLNPHCSWISIMPPTCSAPLMQTSLRRNRQFAF
jgi:hypothetical protein